MIKIICEINVLFDFVLIDFNELVEVLFHRSGKEKYSCVGISIVSLWSCIIGNCCLNHRLRPILNSEKSFSQIFGNLKLSLFIMRLHEKQKRKVAVRWNSDDRVRAIELLRAVKKSKPLHSLWFMLKSEWSVPNWVRSELGDSH